MKYTSYVQREENIDLTVTGPRRHMQRPPTTGSGPEQSPTKMGMSHVTQIAFTFIQDSTNTDTKLYCAWDSRDGWTNDVYFTM